MLLPDYMYKMEKFKGDVKSNARPIPGRTCKIIVDQTRPKGYSKVTYMYDPKILKSQNQNNIRTYICIKYTIIFFFASLTNY